MPENLGEVRVNIEEEGAQDAADTIGDAMSEPDTGSSGGAGGGGDGSVGGLLGGISAKLAGILGFVAFLATLKPIQELLSGLQRLFAVAILPLVSLLNTFLRPILEALLKFIGNLDFNNLISSLVENLRRVGADIAKQVSQDIAGQIPGIGGGQADEITAGLGLGAAFGAMAGVPGAGGIVQGFADPINLAVDWSSEKSSTRVQSNMAETSSDVAFWNSVGGE